MWTRVHVKWVRNNLLDLQGTAVRNDHQTKTLVKRHSREILAPRCRPPKVIILSVGLQKGERLATLGFFWLTRYT